jgi:ABC-type nitrate/sulfonate/bicarbonate transport system permease component
VRDALRRAKGLRPDRESRFAQYKPTPPLQGRFAWRTLIAAESVFGVSSRQGGLGRFIFENRNLLDIPAVFAGLLTVIIIGLIVENLIFRTIEKNTVQKWGTQS